MSSIRGGGNKLKTGEVAADTSGRSWWGDLAATIAPIAMMIPGGQAVGAAAGGLAALDEGKAAKRRQNAAIAAQERQLEEQQAFLAAYMGPLFQEIMANRVYDPRTGTYVIAPSEAQLSLVSPQARAALAERAQSDFDRYDPYGANAQDARYAAYAEDTAGAYDTAVALRNRDRFRPGAPIGTSEQEQAITGIRREQGSDLAGFRRNLRVSSEEARYQRASAASEARYQRMASLVMPMLGMQNSLNAGLGGMTSLYGQQAAGAANALGTLAQGAVASGLLGKKDPNAGNNRLNTNNTAAPLPGMIRPMPLGSMIGAEMTQQINAPQTAWSEIAKDPYRLAYP